MDEAGERIPLTIAAYDREKGTVTIIYQIVGATMFFSGFLKILKRSLTLFLPTFIMFLHELN